MPFKSKEQYNEYHYAWEHGTLEEYYKKYPKHIKPGDWRKLHPEEIKRIRQREKFKRRYGITLEEYEQMVLEREGKCDICHRVPIGKGPSGILNVDHDHETGKIRGLLCLQCNVAIGYLNHEILRLEAAIRYLS